MGKGDGEVEEGDSASSEEEELETSALYKEEDDVQIVLQASGEKARERFENEVRKICATIQLVVVKIENQMRGQRPPTFKYNTVLIVLIAPL